MLTYHVQLKTMFPDVFWEIRKRMRDMATEYLLSKHKHNTKGGYGD